MRAIDARTQLPNDAPAVISGSGSGSRVKVRSPLSPLGGTDGNWPLRLLRFHVPLACASAALLLLFMTVPAFDPSAYPRADMGGQAALPQRMEMDPASTMPPSGSGALDHGGSAAQPPSDHGVARTSSPTDHGGTPAAPGSGHGSSPGLVGGHVGDPRGAAESRESAPSREGSRFTQRLTVATGYVATGLLAVTLLIGPINLILRRRHPISSYLRRDVGMWTAGFGTAHVLAGLQVHSAGQLSAFLTYFFAADGRPLVNSFGLGNWTGLIATTIVIGLLTISSDLALRTLKAPTWKWLQRLNYALFVLVVLHAIFYGALLRVNSPFTLILTLCVIGVLVGQVIGIRLWRQRVSRRLAT